MMTQRLASLMVLAFVSAGCPDSLAGLIQQCEQDKAAGIRTDSADDCGCNPPAGAVCAGGELCISGVCCNPALPGTSCLEPAGHTDGGSSCNPASNLTNDDNCGCNGPCNGATCAAGACQCPSAELIYCSVASAPTPAGDAGLSSDAGARADAGATVPTPGGACVPIGECPNECLPTLHETDVSNCWCTGPCAPGDTCTADAGNVGHEACVCDPLAHQTDNDDCGCHGKCETTHGSSCEGGACVCDPSSCGQYQACVAGACACVSSLCPAGDACTGGTCACDPAQHKTKASCGCPPVACPTGDTCRDVDGGYVCK